MSGPLAGIREKGTDLACLSPFSSLRPVDQDTAAFSQRDLSLGFLGMIQKGVQATWVNGVWLAAYSGILLSNIHRGREL